MRGKLGVSTVTHKMKKPKRVACDCERCKHSNKKNTVFCIVLILT